MRGYVWGCVGGGGGVDRCVLEVRRVRWWIGWGEGASKPWVGLLLYWGGGVACESTCNYEYVL